jgi:hypothetical protein
MLRVLLDRSRRIFVGRRMIQAAERRKVAEKIVVILRAENGIGIDYLSFVVFSGETGNVILCQ